jgi:release factor glutamine methyltransferase
MSLTIADWLATTQQQYVQAGYTVEDAVAECRVMLAKHLNLPFSQVLTLVTANPDTPLPDPALLARWVTRRLPDHCKPPEPLAYVLEEAWFYGQPFRVTPDVLIPRPETEVLVDWAIQWLKATQTLNQLTPPKAVLSVLDIGTGSGCMACILAHQVPGIHVDATDVSKHALAIAKANASARLAASNMGFYQGDGFAPVYGKQYDLIVSNPPYIPDAEWPLLSADVQQEPRLALTSGAEGLRLIQQLLAEGRDYLKPGGWMGLELEHRQWSTAAELAQHAGWVVHPPLLDLEGQQRFLLVSL